MAKQVTNLSSDGLVFGQTVTDKIGFYGLTTAIVQPSASAQATFTAPAIAQVVTTTPTITAFGFTSAQAASLVTQANLAITAVNQLWTLQDAMRTALVNLGLMKGSA